MTEQSRLDAKAATKVVKDPATTADQLLSVAGISAAIDRLLTRNPKASTSLLEKLSHSSDKTTRKYVVLHPNAPKNVLVKLAHQFPADFFKNPAFDWLLLEAPDLMQRIGGNVLGTLLKRPDCPQSFLNWAVKHGTEKERLAAAMNPEASEEALLELVSRGGAVAEAAQAHEKLAASSANEHPLAVLKAEVRKELAVLSADDAESAWEKGFIGPAHWAALSPEARLEVLGIDVEMMILYWLYNETASLYLAKHGNADTRRQLAELTDSSKLLSLLSTDEEYDVREAVAENGACPLTVLEALSKDENDEVRIRVVGNSASPVSFLEVLANDHAIRVRQVVARNASCPDLILEALAVDRKVDVRQAVAMNPACPALVLESLTSDKEEDVREAVARNPFCPAPLLEVLANDQAIGVRKGVAWNPVCPALILESLALDRVEDVRQAVAMNPTCPASTMEALASDENWIVRTRIAENLSCSTLVLERLAKDSESHVRKTVAESVSCSTSILEALAKDAGSGVREAVAKNPASPNPVLETLARDEGWGVRNAVARNPACPASILEVLAKAKDSDLRADVASNKACPPGILKRLINDRNSGVRILSVRNPASLAFSGELVSSIHSDVLLELAAKDDIPDALRFELFSTLVRKVKPRRRTVSLGNSREQNDLVSIAQEELCPPEIRQRAIALQLCSHQYPLLAGQYGTSVRCREELAALADESRIDLIEAELGALLALPLKSLLARLIGADQATSQLTISNQVADAAAKSLLPALRLLGLSSPVTSPATLGKSSRSAEWTERLAVAMNSSCPPAVTRRLKKDPHHVVAGGARAGEEQRSKREAERAVLMANSPDVDRRRLVAAIQERLPTVQDKWLRYSTRRDDGMWNSLIRSRWQVSIQIWQAFSRSRITDPAYPPELLRILATNQDSWIRGSVAENPTCPVDVLEQLANDRSPHVRVKLLENPASTIAILKTLARDKKERWRLIDAKYPEEVLRFFVKGRDISSRRLLAELNDCPVAILNSLAADKDASVKAAVATNPSCPAEVRKHILETIYQDEWDVVRQDVAQNLHCPVSILEALATDEDRGVRSAVAKNSTCPASILEVLAKEDDRDVRIAVAGNGNCPVQLRLRLLEALAKHEVSYVREAVANNLACPASILEILVKDEDIKVRTAVAEHAVCPSSVLDALAKDDGRGDSRPMMGGKADVRKAVAANPASPYPTLGVLANDEDSGVRRAVALNPSCPISLLEALGKDENRVVRYSAASSQRERMNETSDQAPESSFEEMASDGDSRKRVDAAENPDCPAPILERLVKDENLDVRAAVAKNPNCSSKYLDILIEHPDPWIAYLTIAHCNATESQLVRWASDSRLHPELRLYSTRQPAFPANAERLVREVRDLATAKPALLENVTEDELDVAFNALALAPDSDTDAVSAIKSDDWLQRAAAIVSRSGWLQPHQLKLMLDDPEKVVRQLAAQQLREREKAAT